MLEIEFVIEERDNEFYENNHVFFVLTRSHARACQIAREILTLIKNGYADGAMARWRALHEISVISSFIAKHGNEVAEKYLLHSNIESNKAAVLYQKLFWILDMNLYLKRKLKKLKNTRMN